MSYIIHGAGAIGSLIGGMLAEQGFKVVFIARQAHAEAINQKGLTIRTIDGDRLVTSIKAVTHPTEIQPEADDRIILCVKTGQTAASVQALREAFNEDTAVICMQNGVRNEELAARRFRCVYGAMPGMSATLVAPGIVSKTLDMKIGIGNYPLGYDEVAKSIGQDFSKAGFEVTLHEKVLAVKWRKLLMNLNNATLAITSNWVQLARATPRVAHFMAEVMSEGLHTVELAGISLDDPANPYDTAAQITALRAVKEDPERIAALEALNPDLRTYPSTWVDLKNLKGETEAGYFNGEIVLLGEKHGVPTPYNSVLLRTVEQMAASSITPGRYTLDDLEAMVEERRLQSYSSIDAH